MPPTSIARNAPGSRHLMKSDQTPKPRRCQPGVLRDRSSKESPSDQPSANRTKFWPLGFAFQRISMHLNGSA
jgi:hypothetical protein